MDPKELATAAQQFLARTQLSGQEVPAYVSVMEWLDGIASGGPENGRVGMPDTTEG